ncbi:anaerobic sulfite reductase subunit A [Candidatus Epulonipiscium fishelsonii]|uniref:Anaerobic sulfite reductase subunit A n=1 Tax=Candidatus Epulonipiscium fishelsonii TaxID=77094 RepID=A0ACC8XE37_9FIRM|nr:anaerobic sulfite reductase subunit A [Epulopiscium sp. SCG-B11WGA-EpuloA1]ONI43684.1 anaerobic sulfite reductase subunit A [Epulopiscium sp. SCG-B05WGA-EpuloA1]
MGFILDKISADKFLSGLKDEYYIFAPKRFELGGIYSDTDAIRYSEINSFDEIVFDEKSQYSFKETILQISQTIFYFTEDQIKEPNFTCRQKKALIFLRNCDLHGLKRLDDMYLNNGPEDYYYKKLRDAAEFVVMGCENSFENCFCVSMGTNQSDAYDLSIDKQEDKYLITCKNSKLNNILLKAGASSSDVVPKFVTSNNIQVNIPDNLSNDVATSKIWDEYDVRCIACGRCNFVCPTCTCFTMQDIFYTENGKVGERRRVWASCMIDGFTDMAGGHSYRVKKGQRMRYKVLHKVLNHKKRHGEQMCVGCGRCDDICPEYISFSNSINKLENAMKEVTSNE